MSAKAKTSVKRKKAARVAASAGWDVVHSKSNDRLDTHVKETVNGGTVYRSGKTGQFVSVSSKNGIKRSSSTSVATIKEIAEKRKEALKRLSDR